MSFVSIISFLATALAAVAAAVQIFLQVRTARQADEALRAAQEPKVEQALRSDDLQGLGDYFFDTLGRLSLADYAEDADARRVVSGAVRNVGQFLRADLGATPEEPRVTSEADAGRAEVDIAEGDLWGGLSRLRRSIESALREAAEGAKIPAGGMGAGQLLGRLERAGVVDSTTARILGRAIEICNRGVHGQEVSGEEAEQALALSGDGLMRLRQGIPPR